MLLRDAGYVEAFGQIQYFNVSQPRVRQGESIVFKCGATRSVSDDGEFHSLVLHIRKSFNGSRPWLLSVNEDLEIFDDLARYDAELREINDVREVELNIFSKKLNCLFAVYDLSHLRWIQNLLSHDQHQRQKYRGGSRGSLGSVSYTHLTLPTIYSV